MNVESRLRQHGEIVEYTQEMVQEYIRCKEDIIYFAETYFYIVNVDRGKELINLFEYQKKMLKAMIEPPLGKRHLCILSSRQLGKTTTNTIYLLHYGLFNESKSIAIIANKESTAIKIMKKVKLAYEMLPKFLQQGITKGGWNKKTIEFENGSTIEASSTSSTTARGSSSNCVMLDEFAFVPKGIADEFYSSVYPIISSGKTTKIIMVSTANGMNHFYNMYMDAKNLRNNFYAIEIKWNENPNNDEQFKEDTIKDIGLLKWLQEYENKFLGSNSILIDGTLLEKYNQKDPIDFKWNGCLSIYEHPDPSATYIMGVDTAKGIGKDYSVIQILKINGIEDVKQVAIYRNNRIDPHSYAKLVIEVSNYYNRSWILIENNGKEGGMLAEALWWEYECDRLVCTDNKQVGILSSVKTKFIANMNLKRYIENKYLELVDRTTISELNKYEEVSPNVFRASSKDDHDDCVTALIWALYFIELNNLIGLSFDQMTKKIVIQTKKEDNFASAPVVIFDNGDEENGIYVDEDGVVWS